jgi:trehalose/maltose hydrolase-like predicted phosphorylase
MRISGWMRPGAMALSALALAGCSLACVPQAALAAPAPPGSTSGQAGASPGWLLTSTSISDSEAAPTFVGNGYLGERIPALGMGYASSPVQTQSQVAGFYAQPPGHAQQRASVPTWSTLAFSDGSGTYGQLPLPPPCVFDQVCQAEYGQLSGGTSVAANHGGYTGSGFVQGYGATGASDTLTVHNVPAAGQDTLTIRYANWPAGSGLPGSCLPRTLSVVVNGTGTATATFGDTGSWHSWRTVSLPVTLTAGSDTVGLVQNSDDCGNVNIDYLAVSPAGGAVPAPATPPSTASEVTNYKQTLDLHSGLLTTHATWTSPAGRVTDLTYQVLADQADPHVAAVRLVFVPHWSGTATVTGMLDGTDASLTTQQAKGFDARSGDAYETVTAVGTGIQASLASRLSLPAGVSATVTEVGAGVSESAGQRASFPVTAGTSYTVTKYVGLTTSQDAPDPLTAARAAAARAAAAGYRALRAAHEAAWAKLWRGDIQVKNDLALQLQVRASMFYLLESTRAGVNWSLPPAGLSSNGYDGRIFWDADTWMYPALLAQHPGIAVGIDTYRRNGLKAAQNYAAATGFSGARYPWEAALTGAEQSPPPGNIYEQHITADVALAQWQYYLATGDKAWLAAKAWPVIQGAAQFWASRAVPAANGGYSIDHVQGPDEYYFNVNNEAYTNAGAATTLKIAAQAAKIIGAPASPAWATIAAGLAKTIPFNSKLGVYEEFDGYQGSTIKQADVTMLQYPWQFPMPKSVAQADLDYYAPRTDVNGPSMSDAINAIDTAALGTPGCSDYTFLLRSADPFIRGPFDQFSETRDGGAFTFTTGIGGFLQEFQYGFTGLRWNSRAVQLSPTLPPQIPGITVRDLAWHGRRFTVAIGRRVTTITLNSGGPLPVRADGTTRVLRGHASMVVPTRRPDLTPTTDLARCQPVTASSAVASYPATGAVDGSAATSWQPATVPATLDVRLSRSRRISAAQVTFGSTGCAACSVWVSKDGQSWQRVAGISGVTGSTQTVRFAPVHARYVRLAVGGGQAAPHVAAFTVPTQAVTVTAPGIMRAGATAVVSVTFINAADRALPRTALALTAPEGWKVRPPAAPAGTVGPHATATAAFLVTAPSAVPAGSYRFTATARFAGHGRGAGNATLDPVTVTGTASVAVPYASMAAADDNVGITTTATAAAGNFDGDGNSYSQTALAAAGLTPGAALTVDGVKVTWPDMKAGTPDNVIAAGQAIPLSGSGSKLVILGTSDFGADSGTATIVYTDGSTQSFTLGFSDWYQDYAQPGTSILASAYRNHANGSAGTHPVAVYAASVTLSAGKTPAYLILPGIGAPLPPASVTVETDTLLHVFAVGVGG